MPLYLGNSNIESVRVVSETISMDVNNIITQEAGQSESLIMSQKAVTDYVNEKLNNSNGSLNGESTEDIEIIATEGKFAKWVTGETTGGAESSVAWAAHSQFISVVSGETLRITCKAANACPGIVFYNTNLMSSNNGVGYALENRGTGETTGSTNRELYINVDVIVPDGATYAILNNADSYEGWKCQRVTVSFNNSANNELIEKILNVEYENEQLERRATNLENNDDFIWEDFDKSYFIFVHDDSREFITTAYKAFHDKNVPLSSAAISTYLANVHEGKTVKEWLELIVENGGEILCHYSYDLLNSHDDSVWYQYVVEAKRVFEKNGFNIRGLILGGNSEANTEKGEKFCRKYFDYSDKAGTSTKYNLGRKGMWNFTSLDDFKARIDDCASQPGVYAFGFHGNRNDETWITEDSLKEIIDYILAKNNCEITTYSNVFDKFGTTKTQSILAKVNNTIDTKIQSYIDEAILGGAW